MSVAAFHDLPEPEQELHLADWQLARDKCSECGGDRALCSDLHRPFYPQVDFCGAEQERMAAERRLDEIHADAAFHDGTRTHWSKEATPETPYHYRDGVKVWVSEHNLNPGNTWFDPPAAPDGEPVGDDEAPDEDPWAGW